MDPRAELYAVCIVMYKAVTGESLCKPNATMRMK